MKGLPKDLEAMLGVERADWNLPLLRSLWSPLIKGHGKRSRSPVHEATWLNLAGFVLRPGYGFRGDSERIDELWKIHAQGPFHPQQTRCQLDWYVLWRRVSGGLSAEQQTAIYDATQKQIRKNVPLTAEMLRMLASLELLPQDKKLQLCKMLLKQVRAGKQIAPDCIEALGRIAGRCLLRANTADVVPAGEVEKWFQELSKLDWSQQKFAGCGEAFVQMARLTGDDSRDVSEATRLAIDQKIQESDAQVRDRSVLTEVKALELRERELLLGDSLPAGLQLLDG